MDGMFADIKAPDIAAAKASRGVVSVSYQVGEYVIAALGLNTPVDVQAGRDTEFGVDISALPPNASVARLAARLHVGDASGDPAKAETGVSIVKNNDPKDAASGSFQVGVDQPVRPRNVQLKLKDGETFWTFGGILAEDTYDLPDFAQALNTYLDKARPAEPLTKLPFVFKSDSPGKIGIEIVALEFSQVKTQAWPNPLDGTTRVDRNLDLAFGAVEQLPLDPLVDAGGPAVRLQSLKLDVGGQFGPERLLGEVEVHDGRQFATVDAEHSLAQSFTISSKLVNGKRRCSGIIAFFSAAQKAELYLELQKDAGGFPAAGAPLAQANVTYAPPDKKDASQPWTLAAFAAPAELTPDTPYWIVTKGAQGSVRLGLLAAASDGGPAPVMRGALLINRGGAIWKNLLRAGPAAAVVAMLGVIYLPGSDDQTAAIELVVTGGPAAGTPAARRVDPGQAAQTLSLDTGGADWRATTLEVRSHGQGKLSLANVIREYKLA